MASKILAVFGGTGNTGLCVVNSALEKGYDVRMLVRDECRVPPDLKERVKIVIGDVLKEGDVAHTLEGTSGVVVALGTRNDLGPSTVMSDGLMNVINQMKKKDIQHISVCLSAFLFQPEDKVPTIFRHVDKDHRRMLEYLEKSELNWVAVFPPHIAENPKAELIVSIGSHPGPRVISKHNLGEFLVDSLFSPTYYRQVVGIANPT